MESTARETPVRAQYMRVKKQYPNALLLFRMGDFYETFDDDAKVAAQVLDIVLTSREMGKGQRVPLAGIPVHALDTYLARLVAAGYKVAICDQTSDPATSKGLVDREVVRVATPGTVLEPELLDQASNNFLTALIVDGSQAGLSCVDITTSEFVTTQLPADRVSAELDRLQPSELLLPEGTEPPQTRARFAVTPLNPRIFRADVARELLQNHFYAASLEAYGCERLPLAIRAAGAVLHYLQETQVGALPQIQTLATVSLEPFMVLDPQTVRNLELFQGGSAGERGLSLLAVLDLTETPMGGRLLRRWIGQPLLDLEAVHRRHAVVMWFHDNTMRRARVRQALDGIGDLERLINRVRAGTASPREMVALRRSLEKTAVLKGEMADVGDADNPMRMLVEDVQDHHETAVLIAQAIADDPAPAPGEGGVVRDGFSQELDALRFSSKDAKGYIAALEAKERDRTGIKSLKVGYNKVFGYYIEVTKSNLHQVPGDFIRKQTIANGERFFTPELKEYEAHLLSAQDRMAELEITIFRQVCRQAGEDAERVLRTARTVAAVDVLVSFAEAAVRYSYVCPAVDNSDVLHIVEGRHPVVERMLEAPFVPNDIYLSSSDKQVAILTGPNMSGKSTVLRQTALIALMAQVGSFVPAKEARVGLVDRIFTRIGLQDDLATGRSTFMVEMTETAGILNHATPRSLIILDEIGRGTSTYDGLSLAWAVTEYIHNHPRLGAKTLFATHYHELVDLGGLLPRAFNLRMDVLDEQGEITFLRRVVPGGADRSYGVHVAKLAGLPRAVIQRAEEVLAELEQSGGPADASNGASRRRGRKPPSQQMLLPMSAEQSTSPVVEELLRLDVNSMTPIEALTKLYELQKRAREGGPG